MDKFSVRITSSLEKYNQYLSEGDSMKAKAAMQKFNEIRQAQTLYDYEYIFKHSDSYFSLLNFYTTSKNPISFSSIAGISF